MIGRERLGWLRAGSALMTLGGLAASARADEFDAIDGRALRQAVAAPGVAPVRALTVGEIAARPALLRDTRSALILARTGQGNPARLLVVPELRKPAGGAGEPLPVVVLERVATHDAGDPGTRLARARDLVLYDGFRVDLDTGHIVPEGQGDDLVFRAGGEGGPRLEAVGEASLVVPDRAPVPDRPPGPALTPGRVVKPTDFAGRFRLFANGQWSGTLDLRVDAAGAATGQFASDLHGTNYPVTGQVAADRPGQLRFAVNVPRTRLEFDGYLFAEGKGAMAGTVSLLERSYGFFAVREGGSLAPAGVDVAPPRLDAAGDPPPHRHRVEIGAGGSISLDGKPVAAEALAPALRAVADAEPDAEVEVAAAPDQSFKVVQDAIASVRGAGIGSVRIVPAKP